MEDQFLPVSTWQGCIMVSTSLLPRSDDEKTRIYPARDSCNRIIPTIVHTQQRDEPSTPTTELRRPPVPDYWNHEPHKEVSTAMALHNMGPMYTYPPSPSVPMSGYSIHAPHLAMTPRIEDDLMSNSASNFGYYSSWTPSTYDGHHASPNEWEEAMAAASPASLPMSIASGPSTPLLSAQGLDYPDDRQSIPMFNAGYLALHPSSPELERAFKSRRLSSSWQH